MRKCIVEVWKTEEKLPDGEAMIIAESGGEWYILMYGGCENPQCGYEWEGQSKGEISFTQWAYLSDLRALGPNRGTEYTERK